MTYKILPLFLIGLFMHFCVFAQSQTGSNPISNEGFMRSEGKVYVAMAVAVTILIGLLLFVWRLDKKISKLEQQDGL